MSTQMPTTISVLSNDAGTSWFISRQSRIIRLFLFLASPSVLALVIFVPMGLYLSSQNYYGVSGPGLGDIVVDSLIAPVHLITLAMQFEPVGGLAVLVVLGTAVGGILAKKRAQFVAWYVSFVISFGLLSCGAIGLYWLSISS